MTLPHWKNVTVNSQVRFQRIRSESQTRGACDEALPLAGFFQSFSQSYSASLLPLFAIISFNTPSLHALPGVAYFGSSGGSYTDYYVTERVVSPPDVAPAMHTEKLLYFPHTWEAIFVVESRFVVCWLCDYSLFCLQLSSQWPRSSVPWHHHAPGHLAVATRDFPPKWCGNWCSITGFLFVRITGLHGRFWPISTAIRRLNLNFLYHVRYFIIHTWIL